MPQDNLITIRESMVIVDEAMKYVKPNSKAKEYLEYAKDYLNEMASGMGLEGKLDREFLKSFETDMSVFRAKGEYFPQGTANPMNKVNSLENLKKNLRG